MPLAVAIKHFALNFLPQSLLQPLRKAHYVRKLKSSPPEPEMAVIPHLLPPGGCALDLGANFGLYSQYLAQTVGGAGQVHAVEPIPDTFAVLQSNIRRLRMNNVHAYNVAVSDLAEAATMTIPQYDRGGDNLYEASLNNYSEDPALRTVRVRTETLDELFGRLGRIDFVKCDVEGHELNVLRGATEILRVHRPAWLMEISGDPDDPESSAAEVIALMDRSGYKVFHLDGDQPRPRAFGDHSANYFFLRPEHVRRLKTIARTVPA